MHPPLGRPHPECQKVVKLLISCHEDNPFTKYFGACNDHKAALDWCFKKEKHNKRSQNFAKSKAFDKKWEKIRELKRKEKEASNKQ